MTDPSYPDYTWSYDTSELSWEELSELYRVAPLGVKPPDVLRTTFGNSMFKCFVRSGDTLVGAGRVLADGVDCAYIADVAVHPDHQGMGLGGRVIRRLVEMGAGHRKIILYANPGTEGFYHRLGFYPMNTAQAIWGDQEAAVEAGLLRRP